MLVAGMAMAVIMTAVRAVNVARRIVTSVGVAMMIMVVIVAAVRTMDVARLAMGGVGFAVRLGAMGMSVMGMVIVGVIIVGMIVPAARPMHMRLGVGRTMSMPFVPMLMMVMSVPVAFVPMLFMTVAAMGLGRLVGALLGPERPRHPGDAGAEAAYHLGEHVVVHEIDRALGNFRRHVPVAQVPRHLHQPQRIGGGDLHQILRCGLDANEAAILQLHRVAVVQHRRLVEVEQESRAAVRRQGKAAAVAGVVIEGDLVGHLLRADGGTADDDGGADHDFTPEPPPNAARPFAWSGPVRSGGAVLPILVGLEQEPQALFGLVHIFFQQAGGGNVLRLVADAVGLAH